MGFKQVVIRFYDYLKCQRLAEEEIVVVVAVTTTSTEASPPIAPSPIKKSNEQHDESYN